MAPVVPAATANTQAVPLEQTALSVQVRQMRKGGTLEGLQRNVSNGFDAAMRRLEAIHGAISGEAETSFEAKINHWHANCSLGGGLRRDLHILRIWRNASDHHDSGRWQREGPHSGEEASAVLVRIDVEICALEGRGTAK
jgi:hypothetical protein